MRGLALDDELEERLVGRVVDRRCLVLGQHPLPDRVGPLGGVEASRPPATARSCCCRRSRSGRRRARSWPACGRCRGSAGPGSLVTDRVDGLAVLGQVDAVDEDRGHPALVGIEDELLVADGEPALEPAGGMQDEVDAAEDRRVERRRRLVGGLRVGDLRGAQVAAGAERDAEPAGQRGHHVQHERRLRRAERRRARLHRDRAGERAEHDRRARAGPAGRTPSRRAPRRGSGSRRRRRSPATSPRRG